jgi:Ca2+-binding RTX toxin-like protein
LGGSSDDTLSGGNGNDILHGAGQDTLNGGGGSDTVDYSTAATGVTVDLGSNVTTDDGDGSYDTLSAIENVRGSDHNDTIYGGSGTNIFYGSLGSDTYFGSDTDLD